MNVLVCLLVLASASGAGPGCRHGVFVRLRLVTSRALFASMSVALARESALALAAVPTRRAVTGLDSWVVEDDASDLDDASLQDHCTPGAHPAQNSLQPRCSGARPVLPRAAS